MRILQSVVLGIVAACALSAQGTARDYLSFLSQADLEELLGKGSIGDIGGQIGDLRLWPQSPFAEAIRSGFEGKPSTVAAECLFVLDNPPAQSADERDLKIFNSFTSFSSMKGLLVYSESLKKMETFIYDSYRVASADKPERLPDPTVDKLPDEVSYTLFEKEEQTGDVYSEMKLAVRGGYFEVSLTNLTRLKYLVFTLVRPKELSTTFFVVPTADKVILYGLTVAKTPTFLGLEKLKRSSFFNRLKALASWFEDNLRR